MPRGAKRQKTYTDSKGNIVDVLEELWRPALNLEWVRNERNNYSLIICIHTLTLDSYAKTPQTHQQIRTAFRARGR